MKDPNKREVILWLVIILLVWSVVVSGRRIERLETEINEMQSRFWREVSTLQSEIYLVYDNVDEQLKQEASLVSDVTYEFGELDVKNGTLDVKITVTPKTIVQDMKVAVTLRGNETSLVREGSIFVAEVPVDLFLSQDEYPLLTITTAEEERTEYLESVAVGYLWAKYLPSLQVDVSRSAISIQEGAVVDLKAEALLKTQKADSDAAFTTFELSTRVNGEEVAREDITQDVLNSSEYSENGQYPLAFQSDCSATAEDEVAVYVVATDSFGYRHEYPLLYRHVIGSVSVEASYGGERIYDHQGYLRYGGTDTTMSHE